MKVDHWLRRIAWLEPFWVMLVGAGLLLPARFTPTALQPYTVAWRPFLIALLFLGWPIRGLAYRRLTLRTPLDWPLGMIALLLPVSFWVSSDKLLSWEVISYLAFGLALYFALLNWPPAQQRPQLMAWSILLFGAGLALAAPLLSELALGKLFRLLRFESVLKQVALWLPGNVNTNRVAGALVIVFPLYLSLALRWDWSRRRWVPALLSGLTVEILVVLILSQSRGAYMAACVAAAFIVALRWPRLLYASPLVLIAGGIAVYTIGFPDILEAIGSSTALGGMDARLELWSRGLYALSDFPFTGIGFGTFGRVIPLLYPYLLLGPDTQLATAHNLLLQVGLDLGIPGLVAFLAALINCFVMLGKVLRRRNVALAWTLAAGTAGGLVAMLVHGLWDTTLWNSKPAFLPWLFILLAMLLGLQIAESEPPVAVDSLSGIEPVKEKG